MKLSIKWKWLKWTFGFWSDPENNTIFGIDVGPLEIVWRRNRYIAQYKNYPTEKF